VNLPTCSRTLSGRIERTHINALASPTSRRRLLPCFLACVCDKYKPPVASRVGLCSLISRCVGRSAKNLLSFFFVSCFFSMIDVEASDAWALSGDYSSITVIDSNVCV